MNNSVIKYIITFILLLFAEIFLVSRINLSFYINPHIYPMFIILLPVFIERHLILILAFVMGIIVDMFMGTGAIHASSLLIMAYLRPVLLRVFAPREGYGREDYLTIEKFGTVNFLFFCGFLVLIHHFFLFFFELFSFRNMLYTVVRTLGSSTLSLLLIVFTHILTTTASERSNK
jgi:hypothetical protein